jgi:hypothetical protein
MHQANRSSTGRAASSNNWRVKHNEIQGEQPNRGPLDRSAKESTPASIAEGRRLYVGNLLYRAKLEDVERLFEDDKYKV